jgi:metallo-beta-lactamase family protein
MKMTFYGAARTVTGSKHMLTTDKGFNLLLDCGLYQGEGKDNRHLNEHWGFEPRMVDAVCLSHAHIDHSGLLPKLFKDGFRGKIYTTQATKDLCEIMLLDSARIQESDLKYINKRRLDKKLPIIEPLYDEKDAQMALDNMIAIPYHGSFIINDEITVETYSSGHILGSVALRLLLKREDKAPISLTFTGDIGRKNDAIIEGPFPFPQSDYIICESTYGDRLHATQTDVESKILSVVQSTCIEQKGKIIIPAFSVDRTQEIVYALDQLATRGLLPQIDVFVDSPLSVKATKIMAEHQEYFNKDILSYINKNGSPFNFPTLHYVETVEASKAINSSHTPCIIVSASGMAEAGRIKHHIKNNIGDAKNTILLVGYASAGSLAGRLKAGDPEVKIFGEMHEVKAKVESMENFSAHADYNEMLDYLSCQDPNKVKKLILVHGNFEVQTKWADNLIQHGFLNCVIPNKGESIELT